MITVKKGQTVDFRSPKVPCYIKETKEAARKLAEDLNLAQEACATTDTIWSEEKKRFQIERKRKVKTRTHIILWNKIRKLRNATHQEG